MDTRMDGWMAQWVTSPGKRKKLPVILSKVLYSSCHVQWSLTGSTLVSQSFSSAFTSTHSSSFTSMSHDWKIKNNCKNTSCECDEKPLASALHNIKFSGDSSSCAGKLH